ncbi:Protein ABC transporter 1, mitochondrial [Porphyridium purpureum]|uniref:Protein ABC transporter 1, mitochondrial n=1 Tax=Porphyridium purpureum TaxID=35688 RepID=A0A5J4YZK3_PORPP|nr:Protein ABC transporter 1, mitochondrial [Porphyridium purpureum]|eukprot:POR5284..scf208_2
MPCLANGSMSRLVAWNDLGLVARGAAMVLREHVRVLMRAVPAVPPGDLRQDTAATASEPFAAAAEAHAGPPLGAEKRVHEIVEEPSHVAQGPTSAPLDDLRRPGMSFDSTSVRQITLSDSLPSADVYLSRDRINLQGEGAGKPSSVEATDPPHDLKSPEAVPLNHEPSARNQEGAQSQSVSVNSDSNHRAAMSQRPQPREVAVPESALARVIGFGSLGAKLLFGAAKEVTQARISGKRLEQSPLRAYIGNAGAEQIASSLSRMRGAALKLGQMLSIQDERMLSPELVKALERVRHNADFMPRSQLEGVLTAELGEQWKQRLVEFNTTPIAAASIGQVHKAKLEDGRDVAVKVQYPGVARSIKSDLGNLKRLVTYSGVLPKSAYIDEIVAYAQEELDLECQYKLEAENQVRFKKMLAGQLPYHVPDIITELCSNRVLTSEFAPGLPIDQFAGESQDLRNHLGSLVLKLTMRELFEFHFMQTDPNFSNFFYDKESEKLTLLDFGAAREFPRAFVDLYCRMVYACAEQDRDGILHYSRELGFLTGEEGKTMLDAHVAAAFVVGEPFSSRSKLYDFRAQNVAGRTASFGKTLMDHRLCPPPKEAYSLHRRLSGAYLICMKLGAVIPCRDMLLDLYNQLPLTESLVKAQATPSVPESSAGGVKEHVVAKLA